MNRGFALIAAIFIIVVFGILGYAVASLIAVDSVSTSKTLRATQALHIAEAGIRYAITTNIDGDTDWSDNTGFTKSFYNGSFTVSYSSQSKNIINVSSTGTINGISRTVQVYISRSNLPEAFGFGLYAGNQGGGPLTIQNSAVVDGDFYYNGAVTMQNSASLVNGTMISTSLTLNHSATCASWEELVDPIPPPTFDNTYYETLLQETTKSAYSLGNLNMSSGTLNLSGSTKYYNEVILSNSAKIKGPGTIVTTAGGFTARNSASIGDRVRLVIKGDITLENSVTIGSTTEMVNIGNVMIRNGQDFPMDNLLYTDGDITFDNSSYFYGSILVPEGRMISSNSTKFRGLLYGEEIDLQNSTDFRGSIVVDEVGYFSNNSKVTYDYGVLPTNWPEGLEGGGNTATSFSNWREVF